MRPQPSSLRVCRPRGLAILAALAGAALCAPSAHATHVAAATYSGTHAEGGSVTLTLTADGTAVDSYSLTNLPGTAPSGTCTFTSAGSTQNIPIAAHAFDRTSVNGSFFRGTFAGTQAVSGTLREFFSGNGCDSGSVSWSATTSGSHCSDGVDNDGDGHVDLADPGCENAGDTDEANAPPPPPPPPRRHHLRRRLRRRHHLRRLRRRRRHHPPPPTPACSDGVDNDGDGLVDLADPGCATAADSDEFNPPPFTPPPPPPFVPPPPPGPPSGGTPQLEQPSAAADSASAGARARA